MSWQENMTGAILILSLIKRRRETMAYLLNYTRKPISKQLYDPKLAYSMHLAVSEDGRDIAH